MKNAGVQVSTALYNTSKYPHCFYVPSDQVVTLVVPCENGGYVVGVGQSIVFFDWDTDTKRTLCTVDNGKNTRMNDGKVDASGRLWFGM